MKIREISLIVWFSTSVGLGSLTFADSVSPDPPDAFEAFSLELTVLTPHGVDGLAHSIDISTADGTILVGYLGVPGPIFTSPPWVERTITVAVPGLPSGTYAVKTAYMHDLADGDIEVIDSGLSVTVADAPATQPVHAFFHTGIEHYFITAWDNEANGLLAQNGWEIVDFGFNVWHADDPAPEAAVPVCRFYSELVNSHFYTGGVNECTKLKEEDHGWTYEGIAFQALLPTKGACPVGTTPVWRLYNDRAAQLDSNHRFVASGETYRVMIAEGWIGEGVAFCSPPESV